MRSRLICSLFIIALICGAGGILGFSSGSQMVHGSNYSVQKVDDGYIVLLYDESGVQFERLEYPCEPSVEITEDHIVMVTVSTGSPSNYTEFYDVKNKKSSQYPIFNLLAYKNEKAVYAEEEHLVISNVFDKKIFYKSVERDFSIDWCNPAAFEVEFLSPDKISVKYLEGKDYVEKTEIIEIK